MVSKKWGCPERGSRMVDFNINIMFAMPACLNQLAFSTCAPGELSSSPEGLNPDTREWITLLIVDSVKLLAP